MKHFTVLIFLCASFLANAQDTSLIYLDSQWKKTTKEKASYYRKLVTIDKNQWSVNDFYLNGQLQMSGTYYSIKEEYKRGRFIYYYPNGQKESEGNYVSDIKKGEWKYWHKTGAIEMTGSYDSLGKQFGAWKEWYANGKCNSEGVYVNGQFDKEWKFYFESGQMSAKENYDQGKLVDIQFWNEDGSKVEGELKPEVDPEFVGGYKALYEYLSNQFKIPDDKSLKKNSGRIHVRIFLEEDGAITDVTIVKSLHPLLDKEALRVVSEMPKWKPAKKHNRPSTMLFIIPISLSEY